VYVDCRLLCIGIGEKREGEEMIEEVNEKPEMTPYKFHRVFMAQEHNYYCAVCKEKPAVAECHTGILQPCWDCMAKGYELRKANWLALFLKGMGLI
jgi:hypothetical protein